MRVNLQHLMFTACAVALLAGGEAARPAPASAQFVIPIPGGFGGFRFPRPYQGGDGGYRGRHRHDSDDEDTPSRSRESESVLASLGGPPSSQEETAVLKSVQASTELGVVGSNSDRSRLGRASGTDDDRDYTQPIKNIIDRFKNEQLKARDNSHGDVTGLAIEQSLDKAFKSAKLDVFERLGDDNWTTERLRVLILKRVYAELDRLFDGNNRGNAPMQDLDALIQQVAASMYQRIFEISELLAANQGSALFVQRLYQAHGAKLPDQLREDADRIITKAANEAVRKYDAALKRDENRYALRYRAQRIVFDCLSDNVERISSSETAVASIDEITQKATTTATKECGAWLEHQFGPPGDKIAAQEPMPLRAVWTAGGPVTP
ncbi:MAG: hypothetical protein ACLPKB_06930 [Xanthobacteraceae bacterium]